MGDAKRSRTVCNISASPPEVRAMVAAALSGQTCVVLEQIELSQALDCGGLAVLRDAWQRFRSEKLFADVPQSSPAPAFADQRSEQSQQAGRRPCWRLMRPPIWFDGRVTVPAL